MTLRLTHYHLQRRDEARLGAAVRRPRRLARVVGVWDTDPDGYRRAFDELAATLITPLG